MLLDLDILDLRKLCWHSLRGRGGAVIRSLACRAKVPGFKSRQNLSGQPLSL